MKTVFITGATAGIGKVTARELARQDFHVIIHGRDAKKTQDCVEELKKETRNTKIDFLVGDLSNLEDARRIAKEYKERFTALDILINNAGGVYQKRELTPEGYEKTLVTNHLSHFIITNQLLDLLKRSAPSRIINVASISHFQGKWNPGDINFSKGYGVLKAYSNSKLYNVLFTKYLSELVKQDGITVNCLHPGVVKTKIGHKNTSWLGGILWGSFTTFKGISEEEGAKTTLFLATSPEGGKITGKYFDKSKEVSSSQISNDKKVAEDLWNLSKQMTNL